MITLKFGGYQAPASIHNRAAECFGAALKRRLGSSVGFELIGNVLELGRNSGDLPHMVESGELDFCYISTVRFSKPVPELQVLELPFVVKDRPTIIGALNGRLGRLLERRMLESTPFRALGFWDNGFRHISSIRPIRRPEDCRGLTIRTQVSDLHVECFRALGFEPLPVDVRVFVEEIATGKYHAQDNPLTNTYNFGVHNYQRYITMTNHFWGASAFICRQSVYAQWPADVRAAVDAAAAEANAEQYRLAAAEDEEILPKFPKEVEIIRLTPAEHQAFVAAVQPVLAKHRKALGEELFRYLA
ncbi:MAG: TRAP transporter substrate-binding protein [Rhodospirillaceae bacterium]